MRKWLSGTSKKGEKKKKPEADAGSGEEKQDDFAKPDGCLMFGGPAACDSKRKQKIMHRVVFAAEPTTPGYLRWSESVITFDHADHPNIVPQPGRCPLVIDPIIGTKRLT